MWHDIGERNITYTLNYSLILGSTLHSNLGTNYLGTRTFVIPRQGGGQVCFWTPPPLWPRTFVKSSEDFLVKKAAAGENFLGSFFQKFDGFSKNFENLTVFSASTAPFLSAQKIVSKCVWHPFKWWLLYRYYRRLNTKEILYFLKNLKKLRG